jgi:hypothetical protein
MPGCSRLSVAAPNSVRAQMGMVPPQSKADGELADPLCWRAAGRACDDGPAQVGCGCTGEIV